MVGARLAALGVAAVCTLGAALAYVDFINDPSRDPTREPSIEELRAVAPDLFAVVLHSPGTLTMQTGTASPVHVTITNRRHTPVTYDLIQYDAMISLTGFPDKVTLAADETRDLTGILQVGSVTISDEAHFEIAADVAGDVSNRASTKTGVRVVAEKVPDQPRVPVTTPRPR